MTRHAAANRQDVNPLDPAAFSTSPERREAEAIKDTVPRRVIVVGAGFISHVHAEILRARPDVRIAAVVDPAAEAAQGFARRWGVERVFSTIDEVLAKVDFDCAHVVVPPALHERVGLQLLEAGKSVLLEKPMATTVAACDALIAASERSGAILGVNQNLIYHPIFERLAAALRSAKLGPPSFISSVYRVPLRQLAAGQFGHWMFERPVNMLLEQAVHPLSQLAALAGPINAVRAVAGRPIEIGSGRPFYATLDAVLTGRDLPCQLHFAVGQSFPFWQVTVACTDGVIVADMIANRLTSHARTRWPEPFDQALSGTRTAAQLVRESWGNTFGYLRSVTRLGPRSDPFFRGMAGSIRAFHQSLGDGSKPQADGCFARGLVEACHHLADEGLAEGLASRVEHLPPPAAVRRAAQQCDAAILGGTGFIGTHVVRRFLAEGRRVSVMARNLRNLPEPFTHERVILHPGDIRDAEAVRAVVDGASTVINLAHGGGGDSPGEIADRMVGGAETVARACLAQGSPLLIHVGSTAALYLGPQQGKLTGNTPTDPRCDLRGGYARAKALAEQTLLAMAASEGLRVCILRPGVVVGAGAAPLHGGLGFYNNEQHCIGWNSGRNPLPFVLVEDVAEAVWLASRADIDVAGRCYNLVGDVRPSAREFIAMLAAAQQRPLCFHPQWPLLLWLAETGKWMVKRWSGRQVQRPARRDILSRGMRAEFDCTDAKRELGWRPVSSPLIFHRRAVLVHRC